VGESGSAHDKTITVRETAFEYEHDGTGTNTTARALVGIEHGDDAIGAAMTDAAVAGGSDCWSARAELSRRRGARWPV
jgi:hypothetical protein